MVLLREGEAESLVYGENGALLGALEACHNHIYANKGLTGEKAFREVARLLASKLLDERRGGHPLFFITEEEHQLIRKGMLPASSQERMEKLEEEIRRVLPERFGDSLGLSPGSLAYVVSRLQEITLSRLNANIKGEAFQAFYQKHHRGARGEYFTPQPVVDLAVALLDPRPGERVADPACGSGGFLFKALKAA